MNKVKSIIKCKVDEDEVFFRCLYDFTSFNLITPIIKD